MTAIAADSEHTLCVVLRTSSTLDLRSELAQEGFNIAASSTFTSDQLAEVGIPSAPSSQPTTALVLSRVDAVDCLLEFIGMQEEGGGALWGPSSANEAQLAIAALFPDLAPPNKPEHVQEVKPFALSNSAQPASPVGSDRPVSASIQAALDKLERDELAAEQHPAHSNSEPEPVAQPTTSTNKFVARPLPSTHAHPTSQPRMTKTAALRLGISLPPPPARTNSTSTDSAPIKPRVVATPKSLAAPSIAPRATLTSSRRTTGGAEEGGGGFSKSVPRAALSTAERNAESAKQRRHSVQVASIAPPRVEVRLSKTAMLRTGVAPPPQTRPRSQSASTTSTTTTSTKNPPTRAKTPVKVSAPPKIQVRLTKTAALRTGVVPVSEREATRKAVNYEGVPGHKRRESIQVAATSQPPSIAPRLNRTSMLRQAPGNEQIGGAAGQRARPASSTAKRAPMAHSRGGSRGQTPLGERINVA